MLPLSALCFQLFLFPELLDGLFPVQEPPGNPNKAARVLTESARIAVMQIRYALGEEVSNKNDLWRQGRYSKIAERLNIAVRNRPNGTVEELGITGTDQALVEEILREEKAVMERLLILKASDTFHRLHLHLRKLLRSNCKLPVRKKDKALVLLIRVQELLGSLYPPPKKLQRVPESEEEEDEGEEEVA